MHTEQHRTANDEHPGMQSQPNRFRAQATQRLFLAVVNQAIADVLENGKEAREAERWLLSKDFDALDKLIAFPASRRQAPSRPNSLGKIDRIRDFARPGESRIFRVLLAFGQSNDGDDFPERRQRS